MSADLTARDDQSGAIDSLRERFATQAHVSWSGWMKYFFGKCERIIPMSNICVLTLPIGYYENLRRLMDMPYDEMTEASKDSDRKEADEYLRIYCEYIREMLPFLEADSDKETDHDEK